MKQVPSALWFCARTLSGLANKHGRDGLCLMIALLSIVVPSLAHDDQSIQIDILSSRPDMISGGDALVQISPSAEALEKNLTIWAGGRDVTVSFRVSPITQTLIGQGPAPERLGGSHHHRRQESGLHRAQGSRYD